VHKLVTFAAIILLSIILVGIFNQNQQDVDKSKIVSALLEYREKKFGLQRTILVVNSRLISNVELPQEIDGVPVSKIGMLQLISNATQHYDDDVRYAIIFTNITITGSRCIVTYLSGYNSYFPDFNSAGNYILIRINGVWSVESGVEVWWA
jgi:hypothetical protein